MSVNASNNVHEVESNDNLDIRLKSNAKPIRTLSLTEVDAALAVSDKNIRVSTDLVKAKLASGASLPTEVLRSLSLANKMKSRLSMRRIALLMETGDPTAMGLVEKLCRIKPSKAPD